MKRVGWAIFLLVVMAIGGVAYQHYWPDKGSAQVAANRARPPSVPVVAASVEQKAMPVEIEAIATVQPIASVAVRSRVDSQITALHFKEGDAVHEGDPLFTLDSRAIAAQLRQSQANLAKDKATLENAKRDVERYRQLVSKDYVSRQQFDTAQAAADSLVATIDGDQAMIDNLSAQLTYYQIKAPISGRTGAISAKAGNLIRAADSGPLTTINQISPIYVNFAVPQRLVDDLRAAMKAGPVKVRVAAQGSSQVEGQVAFIDNTIDVASGTIAVRAAIPNDDEKLWPGEFVTVTTILRVEADAVVVPGAAVQMGQNGPYVFVIKQDQTVEVRPVSVERSQSGFSVIAKGLTKGERVVTDGQLRLTAGTRIEERPAVAAGRGSEGA